MKKIVLIIGIILFFSLVNTVTADFRPDYNFSSSVLDDLPYFPQDFYLKKHLFDTQQIQADRLTEEYYLQPEIIPIWGDIYEETYANKTTKLIGTYGVSIYPSRFDVFNAEIEDIIDIHALLYASFGVSIYQGLRLEAKYNSSSVSVKMVSPSDNILLEPTFPKIYQGWCIKTQIRIEVLDYGEHIIEIMEREPTETVNNQWKEQYDELYTSGGSILGLTVPKAKIYIHTIEKQSESNIPSVSPPVDNDSLFFMLLLFLVSLTILLMGVIHVRRRRKQA